MSLLAGWAGPADDVEPQSGPGNGGPNLAIVRLGIAGDVNFFNNSGSVDLLADVVGYFRDGTSVRMAPLAPARLLDTRTAVGPIGAGQMIDLQVAGRGGVSDQPQAGRAQRHGHRADCRELPYGVAVG
jgi:hypothetical protein